MHSTRRPLSSLINRLQSRSARGGCVCVWSRSGHTWSTVCVLSFCFVLFKYFMHLIASVCLCSPVANGCVVCSTIRLAFPNNPQWVKSTCLAGKEGPSGVRRIANTCSGCRTWRCPRRMRGYTTGSGTSVSSSQTSGAGTAPCSTGSGSRKGGPAFCAHVFICPCLSMFFLLLVVQE